MGSSLSMSSAVGLRGFSRPPEKPLAAAPAVSPLARMPQDSSGGSLLGTAAAMSLSSSDYRRMQPADIKRPLLLGL